MTSSYIVRCRPDGINRMNEFLEEEIVAIGWENLGDLSDADKDEIEERYNQEWPDDSAQGTVLKVGYIDRLVNLMDIGDTVLVPDGGEVYVGEIDGDYDFEQELVGEDYCHQRSVKWKFDKIPIEGHKAPQQVYKKLYPGYKSHTVQDIDDQKAVNLFIEESSGAERMEYKKRLQEGRLYGINKTTIEDAMLAIFQCYYPTMRKSGRDNEGDTDLIARNLPGELTVRIQIKHYNRESLDEEPVEQLAKSMETDDIGIVATVGEIGTKAKEEARDSEYDISLIGGQKFTEMVFENKTSLSQESLEVLGLDTL